VHHCKQSIDVIAAAVERDNFMSGEEAKAFGLIDDVVSKRPDSPEGEKKAA